MVMQKVVKILRRENDMHTTKKVVIFLNSNDLNTTLLKIIHLRRIIYIYQ